jgi:ABC-2 type transport system ATP-binding protein
VLQPTAGTIHIAGVDMLRDPVAAKRHIGYIPDRPMLYEKLTGASSSVS